MHKILSIILVALMALYFVQALENLEKHQTPRIVVMLVKDKKYIEESESYDSPLAYTDYQGYYLGEDDNYEIFMEVNGTFKYTEDPFFYHDMYLPIPYVGDGTDLDLEMKYLEIDCENFKNQVYLVDGGIGSNYATLAMEYKEKEPLICRIKVCFIITVSQPALEEDKRETEEPELRS